MSRRLTQSTSRRISDRRLKGVRDRNIAWNNSRGKAVSFYLVDEFGARIVTEDNTKLYVEGALSG